MPLQRQLFEPRVVHSFQQVHDIGLSSLKEMMIPMVCVRNDTPYFPHASSLVS